MNTFRILAKKKTKLLFKVKKAGLGINLDKSDLGRKGIFENAVKEILANPK